MPGPLLRSAALVVDARSPRGARLLERAEDRHVTAGLQRVVGRRSSALTGLVALLRHRAIALQVVVPEAFPSGTTG